MVQKVDSGAEKQSARNQSIKGGARPGAGRPKGSKNKVTLEREAEIKASGLTPLDYMLSLLRDENQDLAVRADMAKAAAPYVHPRLANIQANVELGDALRDWLVRRDG